GPDGTELGLGSGWDELVVAARRARSRAASSSAVDWGTRCESRAAVPSSLIMAEHFPRGQSRPRRASTTRQTRERAVPTESSRPARATCTSRSLGSGVSVEALCSFTSTSLYPCAAQPTGDVSFLKHSARLCVLPDTFRAIEAPSPGGLDYASVIGTAPV